MGQQRKIFQMRKQDKTPEKLNEVEKSNLPNKEFRAVVVKMMKELGMRLDVHSEKLKVFNKELENINKKPKRDEDYNN